jgi:hypothetical protein
LRRSLETGGEGEFAFGAEPIVEVKTREPTALLEDLMRPNGDLFGRGTRGGEVGVIGDRWSVKRGDLCGHKILRGDDQASERRANVRMGGGRGERHGEGSEVKRRPGESTAARGVVARGVFLYEESVRRKPLDVRMKQRRVFVNRVATTSINRGDFKIGRVGRERRGGGA